MKTIIIAFFLISSILIIPCFSQAADYEVTLILKDQYVDSALSYIPAGLVEFGYPELPPEATTQQKLEAFKDALYDFGRRIYAAGKAETAKNTMLQATETWHQSEQDSAIESALAFTD